MNNKVNNKLNDKVKNSIKNIELYSQMAQNAFDREMEDLDTAIESKTYEDIAFYLASQARRKTLESLKRREEKKLKQAKEELAQIILN